MIKTMTISLYQKNDIEDFNIYEEINCQLKAKDITENNLIDMKMSTEYLDNTDDEIFPWYGILWTILVIYKED